MERKNHPLFSHPLHHSTRLLSKDNVPKDLADDVWGCDGIMRGEWQGGAAVGIDTIENVLLFAVDGILQQAHDESKDDG